MIRKLSPNDLTNFLAFCQKKNRDFYVELDGNKIYLTNFDNCRFIFNKCVKQNLKCYIKEENDISGILIINPVGKDNFVRVLANSYDDVEKLFFYLNWQKIPNLVIKANKRNKQLVHWNKRTNKYFSSWSIKKLGFQTEKVLDNEVILKIKDRYRGNK